MRRSLLLGFTANGEVEILAGPNPQAAKDAGRALFSARESKFAEIQLWTSGRGVTRRRRFSQAPAAETAAGENPGGSSSAAGGEADQNSTKAGDGPESTAPTGEAGAAAQSPEQIQSSPSPAEAKAGTGGKPKVKF